jgi:hypothetical protein
MFVICGWMKTRESLGAVGNGYCYDCRRKVPWIIGKETEWVTMYGMRTLPFLSKYHFVCGRCDDNVRLTGAEFRRVRSAMKDRGTIDGSSIHAALISRIEQQQLAGKTELQLRWIRASMEAEAARGDAGASGDSGE